MLETKYCKYHSIYISCNLVHIWIILFQKLHYTYGGLQFYKVVRYIYIYLFELITICRHLSVILDACSGIKCDLELYLASRITFSMCIRQKQNYMSGKDEIRIRLAWMDNFINPSSCRGHMYHGLVILQLWCVQSYCYCDLWGGVVCLTYVQNVGTL